MPQGLVRGALEFEHVSRFAPPAGCSFRHRRRTARRPGHGANVERAKRRARLAAAAERRARPALERENSDRPTTDAPREADEQQQTDERQGLEKQQGADAPQGVDEQQRVDDRQATDARESLARALRDWSNEEPSVDRSVQRAEIAAYYKNRDYAPIWRDADGFTKSAKSALDTLRDAGRDGLRVNGACRKSRPGAPRRELALSEAVADYAAQASGARVNPATISPDIEERPSVVKSPQALDAVAEAGDEAGARLAAFNPPHPAYAALREKLAELRAARGHPRREAAASHESDAKPITNFASLSDAKAKRVEAEIIANMERWRWEPREMGATRLEVNIPQFETTFTRDNQHCVSRARRRREEDVANAGVFRRDAIYHHQSDLDRSGVDHREGAGAQNRRQALQASKARI